MYFFLLLGQNRKEDGNYRGLAKGHMELELESGLSESHMVLPSLHVLPSAWHFFRWEKLKSKMVEKRDTLEPTR